jgi:putative transposase
LASGPDKLNLGGQLKRRPRRGPAILREQEAGANTADVGRRHGISSATFYAWKAKYGGMEVSEARRLKGLDDENTKLKKLLADAMLDNVALKDLLAKKW